MPFLVRKKMLMGCSLPDPGRVARCCLAPLLLLMLLAACSPPPAPPMHLKLEWGSLSPDPYQMKASLRLENASLETYLPYLCEEDDLFSDDGLTIRSQEQGLFTDGLLLTLRVQPGSRLRLDSPPDQLSIPLESLAPGGQTFQLQGQRYLHVARLDEDSFALATSYNRLPKDRPDAWPQVAYERMLDVYRRSALFLRDAERADAQALQASDALFARAETIRQGVSQQLYVVVPSVLALGERFDVTVLALDLEGRLVQDFAGPVRLEVEGEALSLPAEVSMTAGETSQVTLLEAGMAVGEGYALVRVWDPSGRFRPNAIPVRVEADPANRIFWGDLHSHSSLSDGDYGDLSPASVYALGRDMGRLDFMALTDHDYRRPIPDWKWQEHLAINRAFNQPGRFVTLVAYEWSAEDLRFSQVASHKNVYFRDDAPPIYSAWDPRYNAPDKLWQALRQSPGPGHVLTIPHHPTRNITLTPDAPWYGGPGTDWNFHDPGLEPLVEVYSRWGISEVDDPSNPRPVRDSRAAGSAREALQRGYRLSFLASSDTHDGSVGVSVLPARPTINPYPVGLAAVEAPALTREDVFDALDARRCYATSGARRMLLKLHTDDGLRAGEAGLARDNPRFHLEVAGTTDLAEVALFRVDAVETRMVYQAIDVTWFFAADVVDEGPASEGAWYLRVTQADGELGWIGPIFLLTDPMPTAADR